MITKLLWTRFIVKKGFTYLIDNYNVIRTTDKYDAIWTLTPTPIKNYFDYKIIFADYKYDDIYLPVRKSYCKQVIASIYEIYVYLDMDNIYESCDNIILHNSLGKLFTSLQIQQLRKKYRFNIDCTDNINCTDNTNLIRFINNKYQSREMILPWNFFIINNKYVFDFTDNLCSNIDYVEKKLFERYGCIIETNNVINTLRSNLFDLTKKTLVIVPLNMSNMWAGINTNIKISLITHDKFTSMNYDDILKMGSFDQIIFNESYEIYIKKISGLLKSTNCKYFWIINSLPIRYYFGTEYTPAKLKLSDLEKIISLWYVNVIVDNIESDDSIIRYLTTQLQNIYLIVNYDNINNKLIDDQYHISLSAYENDMYRKLYNVYNNWIYNLSGDPNNKYSTINKKKSSIIEERLFNTFLILMMSTIPKSNSSEFFINYINEFTDRGNNLVCIYDRYISNYSLVNKTSESFNYLSDYSNYSNNNHSKIQTHINSLIDKKDTLLRSLTRYKNFCQKDFYSKYDDTTCQICCLNDPSEKLTMVKFICGHSFCLDCTIGIISTKNECPYCKEPITVDKIAIIEDTITIKDLTISGKKKFINYLNSMMGSILVITDSNIRHIASTSNVKIKILNIYNQTIAQYIKKSQVSNVVFVTSPTDIKSHRIKQEINNLIGYYHSLNNRPKIARVIFDCD